LQVFLHDEFDGSCLACKKHVLLVHVAKLYLVIFPDIQSCGQVNVCVGQIKLPQLDFLLFVEKIIDFFLLRRILSLLGSLFCIFSLLDIL